MRQETILWWSLGQMKGKMDGLGKRWRSKLLSVEALLHED